TRPRGLVLLCRPRGPERRDPGRWDHVVHPPNRGLGGASPFADPRRVFRLPRQELLAVGVRDLRVGLHDDAWLTVVDPGQPGSGVVGMPTGEGGGPLAQVPDVALLVLRVPVGGLLEQLALVSGDVAHGGGGDAPEHPGLRGHVPPVPLPYPLPYPPVAQPPPPP